MSETRFPARFGKYILLDRINSGGMAEVYRAKVTGVERFERLVAIKCMLPALAEDQQFTTMFVDEAKLAAQLSHPNVVQIYELGRLGQRLYIAMELVSGRDLRHVVRTAARKGVKLPLPFAAYAIAKAAEGLDYAHRKQGMDGRPLNLVHRDVSPQNILVSYDGDVKVVDFGIAKAEARATETQAGTLKGKFAYMAPEQVAGTDVDRRADIFALGTVLYEVLSGERLFAGQSDLSILDKVSRADTTPVEALLAGGLEELRPVFAKALARQRDERFGWASELAEALEPLLIDSRSIFGAKRAAQVMQSLYADEIEVLAQRTREYARVTADDAAGGPEGAQEGTASGDVFQTGFVKGPNGGSKAPNGSRPRPSPLPGAASWTAPDLAGKTLRMEVPPLEGAGSRRGKAPRAEEPETGVVENEAAPTRRGLLAVGIGLAVVAVVALAAVVIVKRAGGMPASAGGAGAVVAAAPITAVPLGTGASPATGPSPATVEPVPPPAAVSTGGAAGAGTGVAVITTPGQPAPAGSPAMGGGTSSGAPAGTATAGVGSTVGAKGAAAPSAVLPRTDLRPATIPAKAAPDLPAREPRNGHKAAAAEPHYGFISVMVPGTPAQVFVDGEEAGYTPLVGYRVKVGKRAVRVVETGGEGRERTEEVDVAASDTKKTPRKVIIRL